MNVIGVCAIAIIAALLALSIKKTTPDMALVLTLSAGIIIFIAIVSFLPETISKIQRLMDSTGMNSEYAGILFKSLGICFLCQFASDACKDAGQSALASKVELTGKLMIVVMTLPLIEFITQTVFQLLGGQ